MSSTAHAPAWSTELAHHPREQQVTDQECEARGMDAAVELTGGDGRRLFPLPNTQRSGRRMHCYTREARTSATHMPPFLP